MWIGGVLELVCGTLIFLGLFTRLAAFIAAGMMAVAYVQFHWMFKPFPGTDGNGRRLISIQCPLDRL